MPQSVVKAAGCVAWRRSGDAAAEVEVVVVHRPQPHGDWSLPKGKLERGERFRDAAVRELSEETGVRGQLGPELLTVSYLLPDGRTKKVRWWSLKTASEQNFVPNAEIDDIRWLNLESAARLLTWDSDRDVLAAFEAAPGQNLSHR